MASIYENVLTAVQTATTGAGIGNSADVVKRMIPRVFEADGEPIVVVCPAEAVDHVPFNFEGADLVTYRVKVLLLFSNGPDYETALGQYLTWHELLRHALHGDEDTIASVTSVVKKRLTPLPAIDQQAMEQRGYLVLGCAVEVQSIE